MSAQLCPYLGPCPFRVFRKKIPYCGKDGYPHLRVTCTKLGVER